MAKDAELHAKIPQPIRGDFQYISAALSTYQATPAAQDVREAWDRICAAFTAQQAKLWRALKDRRDDTAQAAVEAANALRDAQAAGLDSHIPTLAEVIAGGPYDFSALSGDPQ